MKVALVTTSPSVRSGIGDYTRHLLPYLRERCDVTVFVEPGGGGTGADVFGAPAQEVDALRPKEHDHVLYQLGNESAHAFMARMVRLLGGTVMLHDWVLFDLAVARHPALLRGGPKGLLLALREGGPVQARVHLRNWLARRRAWRAAAPLDVDALRREPGTLLAGWHAPEPAPGAGRWIADDALLRVPADGCRRVRVAFAELAGSSIELRQGGRVLASSSERAGVLEVPCERAAEPVFALRVAGVAVPAERRARGDARRLGACIESIGFVDESGEHELDLALPALRPLEPIELARERFALTLNRSIVRFADSFLVHSDWMKKLVLRERNAHTPLGMVSHGAERRWADPARDADERRAARARLDLPRDAFIAASFGGIQPHKRTDKLIEAVARARSRGSDVRLVLAGGYDSARFDPPAFARALGIAEAVVALGWVPEETAWDVLRAADVCVNLRGPSTGGTSGGIYQSFAFGRAVIATDAAEQAELPDACVRKVPLGDREIEALAAVLVELERDPAQRATLEAAARAHVDETAHWSHVADRYVEALHRFPPPRVARRSLIALRVAMARDERLAKEAQNE